MNYNCVRLQYDLALAVITQLPQQRAAEAPVFVCVFVCLCLCLRLGPVFVRSNSSLEEKANSQFRDYIHVYTVLMLIDDIWL